MDQAIVALTRKGLFKTEIRAREVRSREHARKLWPLVAPDNLRQMVTWVRASLDEEGHLLRRSHFRELPATKTFDLKSIFESEEDGRAAAVRESKEHALAKNLIAAELSRRTSAGHGMPWTFKDPDASDFPLQGDLLLGADSVVTEHPLTTPFGSRF